MAKVNRALPLSRRDLLSARRRIHFRRARAGDLYASAWPPLRGKKKTKAQQAWVDNFKFLAAAPKIADGCGLSQATDLAKDTGYFWRDVISSGLSGKLLHYQGATPSTPKLPLLYRNQVNKYYEGAPRVATPTARLTRVTNQNLGNNTWDSVIYTANTWDTNVFWSPTVHPSRLTFQSQGLYLFGAFALIESNFSGYGITRFWLNGTTSIAEGGINDAANSDRRENLMTLQYMDAGDFMEFQCLANSAGRFIAASNFWCVGITPEALI